MSEQQPLIPVHAGRTEGNQTWHERAGELLESRTLHKTVIALITIDAALHDIVPNLYPEGPDAPEWLEILSHISLIITTLFVVEIPLTLWAFGPKFYNPLGGVTHARLHLFDAFIIVTTFALEVVLRGKERELAGLLVILRFWRLVKLVGGIAVGAGELTEEDAVELVKTREELGRTRIELHQTQEENQRLRQRLQSRYHDDA
ncbi:hypothetical protein BD779DRAFT_1467157 [Infundibulicybe gibba]|nr:hypothetical protein BD779DRAFT_1467157 [Infundibulicybe gibba]